MPGSRRLAASGRTRLRFLGPYGGPGFLVCALAALLLFGGVPLGGPAPAGAQTMSGSAPEAEDEDELDNETCLGCHGEEDFTTDAADGSTRNLHISAPDFARSVHGVRKCRECHRDIVEIPHREGIERKVGCVQCHRSLWDKARAEGKTEENARLGEVVQQIEGYMNSIHARPSMADQSRTNATCYDCHNAHYIYPIDHRVGSMSRFEIPFICGKCHAEQKDAYFQSVHGKEIADQGNPYAAVCTDCHTTHNISNPHADKAKLSITHSCGNCHEEQLKTYTGTYHGQVNTLGYAYTAKCFDCHGSHGIKRVADPGSMVHPSNRVETCKKCHADASPGFATFEPHGNPNDYDRYPFMWIAYNGMILLLLGTFAFFWTHSALWFYREYRDRKEGKDRPHIKLDELPRDAKRYVRRWPPLWRLAHLLFAVSIMTLVLTGTAVLYAESTWAKVVMLLIGGPQNAAIVHRVAAAVFIGVFVCHLIYLSVHLGRNWRTFKIFGPTSLVPSLQDLRDMAAMFGWFFGLRPRPLFDRWSYWKKFDYWAPFWGMTIIGGSGAMLWNPELTASIVPGWVFNVGTILHGEEAFLAAVFLFSVHFFNVHFRPDKFPMDILMFTGVMPLDEYQHEHTLEYDRLVASGELEKYLVDAPSVPMSGASKVLGTVLILFGLTLLVLVLTGFLGHMGNGA